MYVSFYVDLDITYLCFLTDFYFYLFLEALVDECQGAPAEDKLKQS